VTQRFDWPVVVLNLCRRSIVQQGADPRTDSHAIDAKWLVFAKAAAKHCGVRLPSSSLGVGEWSEDEWKRVANCIALGIDLESDRFPWYPLGWRTEYELARKVGGQ
jgi:hypothetical protein